MSLLANEAPCECVDKSVIHHQSKWRPLSRQVSGRAQTVEKFHMHHGDRFLSRYWWPAHRDQPKTKPAASGDEKTKGIF